MTTSDPAARGEGPDLSYEEAREELVEVVRTLESGGGTLEESLALWERGEELAKICQSWLDGARRRLDAAMAQRPGSGQGGAPDDDRGAGDE
jgi:exodeoxyribonuclease VII small subunit